MKRVCVRKVIVPVLVLALTGCVLTQPPPVSSNRPNSGFGLVVEDDWAWLQRHCWNLRLEWHAQSGHQIRCTYDDPAQPIAAQNLVLQAPTRDEVLRKARNRLAILLGV